MNGGIIKTFATLGFLSVTLFSQAQTKFVSDSSSSNSVQTFVKLMDSQHVKQFGLKDVAELTTLRAGKQFKNFMIAVRDIKNYQGGDVNKIIMEFPSVEVALVSASGKIVSSIEFTKKQANWEPSGFGMTPELIALSRAQGAVGNTLIKIGRLIRIPTLHLSFIAIDVGNQLFFVSLQDRPSLNLLTNQKLKAPDAISRLVALAKKQNGLPN